MIVDRFEQEVFGGVAPTEGAGMTPPRSPFPAYRVGTQWPETIRCPHCGKELPR